MDEEEESDLKKLATEMGRVFEESEETFKKNEYSLKDLVEKLKGFKRLKEKCSQ